MTLDLLGSVTSAGTLANFTQPTLILPDLRQSDAAGVISELGRALQQHGFVPDVLPFYQAALNQELLANSGLECGIALPHARLNGIKQLQFALGRMSQPIVWGQRGSARVDLVFLLAVPATDAALYLNLLASLARVGQTPELLAELRAAPTADAVYEVLNRQRTRPA